MLDERPHPRHRGRRARQAHHAEGMAHQGFPLSRRARSPPTSTRGSGGRATARLMSLRAIARQIAWYFRHVDPPLLRSVQRPPPLRDPERPRAVHARAAGPARRLRRRRPALPLGDGAARRCRAWPAGARPTWRWDGRGEPYAAFLDARDKERAAYWGPLTARRAGPGSARRGLAARSVAAGGRRPMARRRWASSRPRPRRARPRRGRRVRQRPQPRRGDVARARAGARTTRWPRAAGWPRAQRRARALERRQRERRIAAGAGAVPGPPPHALRLRAGLPEARLRAAGSASAPRPTRRWGCSGWDQAVFRRDSDGKERLLSIDQLLKKINDWKG